MRRVVTATWLVAGFALQLSAYFFLGAKIGVPQSPAFSDPRVPFAGLVFVIGVIMVFLSAVLYELLPERESGGEGERDDEAAGS